jgi:hypothetical protein
MSNGLMRFVHNGGVAGERSDQILARIQADALGQPCTFVLVDGGGNDIIQSISQSTIQANMLSIYKTVLSNGQVPIIVTPPPYQPNASACATLAHWMRAQAVNLKIPIFDFYASMVDPSTGGYLSGYSADNLHPAAAGLRVAAQAAVSALSPLFPPSSPLLATYNSDPNNLISNGLLLTSNAGIATGWTATAVSGHVTYSVSTDSHILGNVEVATKTTSSGTDNDTFQNAQITSGFSAGDRMAYVGKVVTSGVESGGQFFNVRIYGYTAGYGALLITGAPVWNHTEDVPNGQWYFEFTVPAGTVFLQAEISYGTGIGTVKFGQIGLYDLTAMGL